MSQTETRPGFRLPWTGERADAEASGDGSEGTVVETGASDAEASSTTDVEASVARRFDDDHRVVG